MTTSPDRERARVRPDVALTRDATLMFELGSLRRVERTWRQFTNFAFANVAEHSFRVAWIAWTIAVREGADPGRCVQMALTHDSPETRTGDVNYLSRMYTDRNETLAFADQFGGTTVQEGVTALWREYEARETLEARIVKDADTLDCDAELVEAAASGCTLSNALASTRAAAFDRLYTDTGRAMFAALYDTDPHCWHVAGRNRHTDGDWKGAVTHP